ncbi:hypothetical protein M231_03391 [Tremella mesenterica]|uniref:Uncharacterized protein n=1 Tax=Tremella mesenterica TaxID=5217 RepID=A0A4Q1BNK7_TREME|nr:hypothetical protein M231_03391 [Tremella mesenterica]
MVNVDSSPPKNSSAVKPLPPKAHEPTSGSDLTDLDDSEPQNTTKTSTTPAKLPNPEPSAAASKTSTPKSKPPDGSPKKIKKIKTPGTPSSKGKSIEGKKKKLKVKLEDGIASPKKKMRKEKTGEEAKVIKKVKKHKESDEGPAEKKVKKIKAGEEHPLKKKKVKRSETIGDDGVRKVKKIKTEEERAKAKEAKAKVKVKDERPEAKGTPKKKKARRDKTAEGSTAKGKDGGKKQRAKPVKKPVAPVGPPTFENVATRLGREEAEQRIQVGQNGPSVYLANAELREFAVRFRTILGVPERWLGPLDDFDRSVTEAGVRAIAGGMLDLIKDEYEMSGIDSERKTLDVLIRLREELRYYADLARFSSVITSLTLPLGLRLPPAPEDRRSMHVSAVRQLLNLEKDDSPPSWSDVGPSRRVGTSRIPQPTEVVRMLIALSERCLQTPILRADVEQFSKENEDRRKHASLMKKEMINWETTKRKLTEARVRCQTAAETKANKEEFLKSQHEHDMRVALYDVNLRSALSHRASRFEPLGVDLDGRVYYVLSQRLVDEEGSRPPVGWASGLMVWGKGVPSKCEGLADSLPADMERWSYFGRSNSTTQLVKWLTWRYKMKLESMRPVKVKTPNKTPIKLTPSKKTVGTPTPKEKKTVVLPSSHKASAPKMIQSTLSAFKSERKAKFEIVIPISAKKASTLSASSLSSISDSGSLPDGKVDSESSVSLSPPPIDHVEELRTLYRADGYSPDMKTVEEQGKELVGRLGEVVKWLEVLEHYGMGEK